MTGDLELTTLDAARGDAAALRTIYDTLSPRVCGYFTVRGAEDPEGLTNEVFVTVFSKLEGLTGGWPGLRTFAFFVAHARMVDEIRRRGRQPVHVEYDPEFDPRTHASAEDRALEQIGPDGLLDVLVYLPDDQRDVVVMRVLGDLSIAQTATATGRSEAAVKRLQSKGLRTLRDLMSAGVRTMNHRER